MAEDIVLQGGIETTVLIPDPIEIARITISDDQDNTGIVYNNPSIPYPEPVSSTSGSSGGATAQLIIYNDPRSALEAVQSLGIIGNIV